MSKFSFCPVCGHPFDSNDQQEFLSDCRHCGYRYYEPVRVTVSAAIFHNHQLLVVRRGIDPEKGSLDLPGGFVNPDEHPEKAIIREIQEELGTSGTVEKFLVIGHPQIYHYRGHDEHTCDITYLFRLHAAELKPADDIDECQYIDRDKLSDLSMFFSGIREKIRYLFDHAELWR